jgi:hypothetical protein
VDGKPSQAPGSPASRAGGTARLAKATTVASVRQQLETLYAVRDRTFVKSGYGAILAWSEANTAPNFRLTTFPTQSGPVRVITRQENIQNLRDMKRQEEQARASGRYPFGIKEVTARKSAITRLDVSPRSDKAVALVQDVTVCSQVDEQGEFGPKGQEHRIEHALTIRDTWVKTRGGWKVEYRQSLKSALRVDGKPWNPKAPESRPTASDNKSKR